MDRFGSDEKEEEGSGRKGYGREDKGKKEMDGIGRNGKTRMVKKWKIMRM